MHRVPQVEVHVGWVGAVRTVEGSFLRETQKTKEDSGGPKGSV